MTLPAREEIERALCQVKGVEGARVCVAAGEITELHVAAAPGSRAKNVVRDVRSYLAAALGIEVPHQKISVAVRAWPAAGAVRGAPEAGEGVLAGTTCGRLQFRSVNLLVEGLRSEAQVELTLDGRSLVGTATGVPATLGTERLIVAATLDAIERLLKAEIRLLAGDLVFTRLGAGDAILAEVLLIQPRREQSLIGACRLGQDRHRSVVYAVLDALNRILSRLAPQQWVEYLVEPDAHAGEPRSRE